MKRGVWSRNWHGQAEWHTRTGGRAERHARTEGEMERREKKEVGQEQRNWPWLLLQWLLELEQDDVTGLAVGMTGKTGV